MQISPVSGSRNEIYKQRSRMSNCKIKGITFCVLDKYKQNRITTDSFTFLVTIGCPFISIKCMKQFSDFSLHVFILNINWSAELCFSMLSCSFGC